MTSQTSNQTQTRWNIAAILSAAALMVAGSHVEIPYYPVPMTLQTVAVLGTGLALGLRQGGAAVATFLGAGAVGLPVFAGGKGGFEVFARPTGGYLIGFAIAVLFCGWARDRGWTQSLPGASVVALLGTALVYPTGLLQLGAVLGWDKPILEWGLAPFILGDITKALIAAFGVTLGARALGLGGR
ncbi:MAG: biotin transporter BioY [Pseudomonadota bacterium]